MDGSKCILQLRGVRPFLSDKYDITQHRNYKHLSDANPKLAFDVGKHIKSRLKVNPAEQYEYIEFDLTEEEMSHGNLANFVNPDEFDMSDEYQEDLEPV